MGFVRSVTFSVRTMAPRVCGQGCCLFVRFVFWFVFFLDY